MSEHTIKAIAYGSLWLTGTIDDFPFGIKVYDRRSPNGVKRGRVSKLYVKDKNSPIELFSYDRGWDRKPRTQLQQDLLNALLRFAASLPRNEVWSQSFRKQLVFFVDEDNVLEVEPDNLI